MVEVILRFHRGPSFFNKKRITLARYKQQKLPASSNHNSPRTIFLAEDDLDDQEFLKEALLALDESVHLMAFSTGVKFMTALSETKDENLPGLIVLDYNIPELNGAEILEQLSKLERYASIPKLVWSTSDSDLYRQNCLTYGARAYLVKPSSVSGIASIAQKMLTYCS